MARIWIAAALLLTAGAACFAGGVGDTDWPRLTAMRMQKPPVIDGRMEPGEWDGATPLSGLTKLGTSVIAARQPVIRVGWNSDALFVGVKVPLPPGQKARATATDWDGTVWQDDSVEVHVDHGHHHEKNYQFVVNALGTKLDSLAGDLSYNADWEAKATNEPGEWTAEFAIPWQAVGGGVPAPGGIDGFNIAVNGSTLGGILTWSPLQHSLHEPARFGHLIYGDTVTAGLTDLNPAATGEVRGAALGKGDVAVLLRFLQKAKDGSITQIGTATQTVKAPGDFTLPLHIPEDQGFRKAGDYVVEVTVSAGSTPLYVQRGEVKVGPPLNLSAQAFIEERYLNTVVTCDPVAFPAAQTDLHLSVSGAGGTVLDQTPPIGAKTGTAEARIDDARLPQGRFVLKAIATNRNTGKSFTSELSLDRPLHPAWLGTKEGITDVVPAPWTPLKVQGDSVMPWGRTYRFDHSLFPTEVTTRDAEVLAGPISFTGSADGQPLIWRGDPVKWVTEKPGIVKLSGNAVSKGLKISGTATVEYDGMIRVDLTLAPSAGKATVQNLMLTIPLRAQHARYLYHFPGSWGSVANSGYLPKDGWAHAFKPFVWLGDEDRGFSWFCESDQYWYPADPNRALTIDHEGDRVVLRCHLADQPREITKPLQYTFGFEATPVKNPEKTVWDYRITHHGNYGIESQPAGLGGRITYPAQGHLDAKQGGFECWYRPAFDTERQTPLAQRKHRGNRYIFTVKWGEDLGGDSNCGFYWNEVVQGLVAWSRKDGRVTHYQEAPFDWKAGEWHHLAMTWSDKIRIYVDGKLLSTADNTGFYPKPFDEAKIEIGGPQAYATIDEIRILNVARPPVPNTAPYQPDAATLLLDHCDDYLTKGAHPVGTADSELAFVPAKYGLGPTWEPGGAKTQLQKLADNGVRTICFHEHWSPYQSYPYVTDENGPRLHSLIDACHKEKIALLLYMSRQFADNAPEWDLYHDDVLQAPRSGAYRRLPEQSDYIVCWKSVWKDFCLDHLAKLMSEFGNDGWYLDGAEWPMPCTNRHHGCGYVADDGSIHPTYDIFATRDFMKRLYVLSRQRNPQAQLNIHNSTVMVIPTLAWGTSSWGGEQLDSIKPPVKTLDVLPMDAFRTEFMGRQWGVPSEFLVYEGQPYKSEDMLAYTLLHGVLIRPSSDAALQRISALWKVYDRFPFKDAKMYPYWNNADVITCGPKGVYATAYQRPQDGLLLFVSNLDDAKADAALNLNLTKLGLTAPCKAWDAITGDPIALSGGTMRFPLDSWQYRVVRVQTK